MIDIEYITTYTGGTITISQEQFELYLEQAEAELTAAAPGMRGPMRDEALCLLICARADATSEKIGVTGEKIGADYSYTKSSGESQYRLLYLQLLKQYGITTLSAANAAITHSDVKTGESVFDLNSVPVY